MSRPLRRLVAGALTVAALTATAPQAFASRYCMDTYIAGRLYRTCI